MSAWYDIYTKENVSIDDAQKIIDEFPDNWFYIGENKRNEKPVRQDWGWSAIVDVWNPVHNHEDEDHGLGIVGVWTIGGRNTAIVDFIESKLKELGYTVLRREFSY